MTWYMDDRLLVVGILGGMGPRATASFYLKLIEQTPASRDQEHLKVVMWADPTVPDRTDALLGSGPDPTPWLLSGAARLARAGADLIAIPCNTAHAFLPAISRRVALPVIDMVEETCAALSTVIPAGSSVGLLATTGTLHVGLYQERLRRHRITVHTPDLREQEELVMPSIQALKSGRSDDRAAKALATVSRLLVRRGATAIVAGCTEIPLALDDTHAGAPLIDSTAVLARAVITRALSS